MEEELFDASQDVDDWNEPVFFSRSAAARVAPRCPAQRLLRLPHWGRSRENTVRAGATVKVMTGTPVQYILQCRPLALHRLLWHLPAQLLQRLRTEGQLLRPNADAEQERDLNLS